MLIIIKNLYLNWGFNVDNKLKRTCSKVYSDGYKIEIYLENGKIDYGNKILIFYKKPYYLTELKDWVTLECVNRLLEMGYKPENLVLNKEYPIGSKRPLRVDICLNRDDGSSYLLVKCISEYEEFDVGMKKRIYYRRSLINILKKEISTDLMMLYCSKIINNEVEFKKIL